MTGFTNSEEKGVGLEAIVPYLLEDALKAKGGDYQRVDDWQPFAVTDGKLVTRSEPGIVRGHREGSAGAALSGQLCTQGT